MKMLKKADHFFEYIVWFSIFAVLAFSVYNDGGINILSHLLVSASLFVFGLVYLTRRFQAKIGIEALFLILFLLFFLFSFLFSQTKNVGLFEFILFVCSVYIYIFLSSQSWSLKTFEKFLFGVFIIALLAAVYGYYDYIFEPFNRFASTFGISIYKFVSYPNAFANFLIATIPIPFYFFLKENKKYRKVFFGFSITILLTALILTYSRGAYIALAIVLASCFLIYISICRKIGGLIKKIVSLFLIILASGVLAFSVNHIRSFNHADVISFVEKVSFESDEKQVSATNRLDFWTGSMQIFSSNPYFGTGPGSFEYVFPKYQKSFLGNSNSPHNLFLKILSENGIFALISILAFFLALLAGTVKIYGQLSNNEKIILFVLSASVTANLLHNMIDYNLNFVSNIFLLFVFLGMIGFLKNKYSKMKTIQKQQNLFKILFFSFAVIMLFVSLHELYYSYVFKQARAFHKEGDYANAIVQYEKSQNILLKRGFYIVYAQLYHEKYEEEGSYESLNKAKNLLLSGLKLNHKDAFLLNYLGDIYYETGNFESARNFYVKALESDPKNNLKYYYDFLRTDDDFGTDKVEYILELLSDYKIQLSRNEHLTVLTGNPESAIEIYDFLLDKVDIGYRSKIENARAEMKSTYLDEKKKFEEYYGVKFEIKD